MQFEFTDPQTEFERLIGGHYTINAFGHIKVGDDAKFEKFLNAVGPPPRTNVYIDSNGGDVEAAMAIGRLIRSAWFSTSVGQCLLDHSEATPFMIPRKRIPGKCLSASTLLYLGGRLRYFFPGSHFGVHQFSLKNPKPSETDHSQVLAAKIARYVEEMGVSSEFLELSASTPGTHMGFVDEERLKQLGVLTGGETDVEWTIQSGEGTLYVRGERDSLFGHHKVMLGYRKELGFLFWAVIEAQGRESELTTFGLVEIVLNGEDFRIDITDRCARDVHGIYVNVICQITQEEARQIANSTSFGVQIRATHEAEMFLGIAAVSTRGGEDKLKTLFEACST